MSAYSEHLQHAFTFIEENEKLIDCHLVDFITKNLWQKCLPLSLISQLEKAHSDGVLEGTRIKRDDNFESLDFVKRAEELTLKECAQVIGVKDLPKFLNNDGINSWQTEDVTDLDKEFMKEKKWHEVEILAAVILRLTGRGSRLVIDAGAGKGYLSVYLAENYGIPVLAVDSSNTNHRGAVERQRTMRRKKCRSSSLIPYTVGYIDDTTDLSELIESHFPREKTREGITLTGLHACGPLGHVVLRTFLRSEKIKSLCVVSCCYHLTDESLSVNYKFSRNARMLAQQSTERVFRKDEPLPLSLFYRAVLQVLLHSKGILDGKVGRGAPLKDFPTYARWALGKIGMDSEQIPSSEVLEELYQSHAHLKWRMDTFQLLRVHASPVVEAAILLDRVTYVQNTGQCSRVALVQLFDPLVSPRCYAIIAVK